jgi:hypothetical protein
MGGCHSGGVRMVHQNHEKKKNPSGFFDRESRRAFGSSSVSPHFVRFDTPESVRFPE